MIYPGFLISLLTFPGVIVHELAHKLACDICKVPVFEVKYFRFANPCGYVMHAVTNNPAKNLFITFGPFLVNTILGMFLSAPATYFLFGPGMLQDNLTPVLKVLLYILLWLGISVLMHSFPSTGDAKSLFTSVIKNKNVNILVKIIVFPFIVLIYLGAIGSVVWLDLVYALAIAMLLPKLLILIM